jgi:hypothetical protein
MLENRIADYREVLPQLQRIRSMGIDIDKVFTFGVAVGREIFVGLDCGISLDRGYRGL